MRGLASLGVWVLFPACFGPTFDHPRCGPNGECPPGQTCSSSQVCEPPGPPEDETPPECRGDDDCASLACVENGACADANRVVYVAPNGTRSADCGRSNATPCALVQALSEVGTKRNIVRLAPGTYTLTNTFLVEDRDATLLARGSTLSYANPSGAIGGLLWARGVTLKLVGGTITGNDQVSQGLYCESAGVLEVDEAIVELAFYEGIKTSDCNLIVSRSILRHNGNAGILMEGAMKRVAITNNFVIDNGSHGESGGMVLKLGPDSVVEHNTVANNHVVDTDDTSGVDCQAAQDATPFEIRYNLITDNDGSPNQIAGNCDFGMSFVDEGNEAIFVNTSAGDYHLSSSAPAQTVLDAVPCSGGRDIDGDLRPSTGQCDVGADERSP